jgi:thiol:disulfide interchange protein DsbD
MRRKILFILAVILVLSNKVFPQNLFNEEIVKIKTYTSIDKLIIGTELLFALEVQIADSWHINNDAPNDEMLVPTQLSLSENDYIESIKISYPMAKEYKFDFSDKPVLVWEDRFFIPFKVKFLENSPTGNFPLVVNLEYQACNNLTCLAPNSISDTIYLEFVNKQTPINQINQEIFSELVFAEPSLTDSKNEDSIENKLEKRGLLLSLILVFLGGLALNLTPCVYPLIPITIGYFGGQSEGKTSRLATMGLLFVLGMAVTYSIIGVATSLTGAVFGALLQNTFVILFIVGVLVALSLSMFGLYEFKLPDAIVAKASSTKTGLYGSFFMGLTMGIVAAPCIGPFVLGLVTVVATKGDPFFGFLMFFILALGLGFPYLFLAIFSGKIKSLPRAGLWMEAVKHIFGFILLGMAFYFALPLIPKSVSSYVLPIYGLIAALYLLFFDKAANSLKGFRIFKTAFSVVVIAASIYSLIPSEKKSIQWIKYSDSELQYAINKKGVIIDFYADWCIPCKELDALTFSDENVIKLSENFLNLKADMTKSLDPEVENLRRKYNILGVPTVLILDSNLNEIHRITGFVNATEFSKLLNDERFK